MIHLLNWLSRYRRIAFAIAVVYFVIGTIGHDVTQELAYWVQDKLNRDRWNDLNRYVGLLAAIITGVWSVRRIRRSRQPIRAAVIGGITLAGAIACFNTLFVMNVEMIHFPQYAIMAGLLYPLTRRFGETVVLATMLGVTDEGYQYLVLHRHWSTYFDINDVTLNLLGAGFGVVLIYLAQATKTSGDNAGSRECVEQQATGASGGSVGRPTTGASVMNVTRSAGGSGFRALVTSPAMIVFGLIVVTGWLGVVTGRISVLPRDDAWLVLRRCGAAGAFWIETGWGKRYHVLQPQEGILLWGPFLAMYFALDVGAPQRNVGAPQRSEENHSASPG